MAERGGARPGAGRKPTAAKYATKIAQAEKRIADRLPDIADAMIDLALGVTVEEETEDGPRVYTRPPNYQAGRYCFDRLMGRPATQQENADGEKMPPILGYRILLAPVVASETTRGADEGA